MEITHKESLGMLEDARTLLNDAMNKIELAVSNHSFSMAMTKTMYDIIGNYANETDTKYSITNMQNIIKRDGEEQEEIAKFEAEHQEDAPGDQGEQDAKDDDRFVYVDNHQHAPRGDY